MATLEQNKATLADTPIFDDERLDAMKEAVGEETLIMLIQMLPDTGTEQYDDLKRDFVAGDLSALSTSAHTLKGTASNLGAARLQAVAYMIELAAKDGDLSSVDVAMIDDAFSNTIDEVNAKYA